MTRNTNKLPLRGGFSLSAFRTLMDSPGKEVDKEHPRGLNKHQVLHYYTAPRRTFRPT